MDFFTILLALLGGSSEPAKATPLPPASTIEEILAEHPTVPPANGKDLGGTPGRIACEIRKTRHGKATRFAAIVRSDRPATGEFDFVLSGKDARRNSTNISQGDTFSIAAGEEKELGEASLTIEPGQPLQVSLELRDDRGAPISRCAL